jgi:hypothetical protein
MSVAANTPTRSQYDARAGNLCASGVERGVGMSEAKRWSVRSRSRTGGALVAASGLLMIVATFVPWWHNGAANPFGPSGDMSGWDLFRAYGVTYNSSHTMPSGQGGLLWTGIVTLLVGIAAVLLGVILGAQFDESRDARPPFSRVGRIIGILLGVIIGFVEVIALYQQFTTLNYELVYASETPSSIMMLAIVLLVAGLFVALKGERIRSELADLVTPS